jgi:ribosome-binding protein aMBF1 (putative translation factor)
MDECFRCGTKETKAILFEAISKKGIVKVCSKCNKELKLPLVNRKSLPQEPEKRLTVYERLSYLAGINPSDKKQEPTAKEQEIALQDRHLRQLMDKNSTKNLEKPSDDSNMIRNFHWLIRRARRMKHMTQKQLAEAIQESEQLIRAAENGNLPRERERFVKKLENFLHIKITKAPSFPAQLPSENANGKDFGSMKESDPTIGDLVKMKKEAEDRIFSGNSKKDEEIQDRYDDFPEESFEDFED